MKYIIALISFLLFTTAVHAFANSNNDCKSQSAKLAPAERDAFMKSCLKKSADKSREKAQKEKEGQCNQNAINKKLEGQKKQEYLQHCYRENDFDTKAPPHPKK